MQTIASVPGTQDKHKQGQEMLVILRLEMNLGGFLTSAKLEI